MQSKLLDIPNKNEINAKEISGPKNIVLVLEDDKQRQKWFRSKIPWCYLIDNTKDCKKFLQKHSNVNVLFLDHDLGGETYVDSKSINCGMEIIRYIKEYKPTIEQTIIHSHNHAAALAMVDNLKSLTQYKVNYIPFIDLTKEWDKLDNEGLHND